MISQNAFDNMVLENMSDFEMEKAEALTETIDQLKKMGKNLSSIDLTGGEGREELQCLIDDLKEMSSSGNDEANISLLNRLAFLCEDNHQLGMRNQNMLRNLGGFAALVSAVDTAYSPQTLSQIFRLISIVCKTNVENRDCFDPWGNMKLPTVLNLELHADFLHNRSTADMLYSGVSCARVLAKSECNKSKLVEFGISSFMHSVLSFQDATVKSSEFLENLMLQTCLLFKKLCTHDDLRREMSCAYENGRRFLSEGFVPHLMRLSCDFRSKTSLSAAALSAARQIVVSEDAVKIVAKYGAMELPAKVYQWEESPLELIRSVTGLMRNLCADDNRKNKLARDGTINLLIMCLSSMKFSSDSSFVEHAFACIAAMTLRSPHNSEIIVELGAIEHMVEGMRLHKDKTGLQRQACLAFRNIAARCPSLRRKLLDSGAEEVLRNAGRLQQSVDEAYGALRDLNIDVQVVTVDTKSGLASSSVEQFGNTKPRFNPVFEETDGLQSKVQDESHAPFSSEGKGVFRLQTSSES